MMGWEDTAATSLITARFLEQQGFEVVSFPEWGIAFGALTKGDVDLLMAHINYVVSACWERYNSRLEKVSVVYCGLKQGLVVPSYMPITSVEELNIVADQVGGKIIGIEPGTGLMREVGEAVTAYGLNYQVVDGSTAAMTAQLKSTLERGDPIVTMLWTPSWMIQQFDVRFLDDPKGIFAPPQAYCWVADKGFSESHLHAREAIASVYVPIEDVNQIAPEINDGKTMDPERIEDVLASLLDRRQESVERRGQHIAELNQRAAEADMRLKRLYEAIEAGSLDPAESSPSERIAGLTALRDQARADAERTEATLASSTHQRLTGAAVRELESEARARLRLDKGGYRRDHVRAFAQRVEVADDAIYLKGSKNVLLRTLVATRGGKTAGIGVPDFIPKWRRGWQGNRTSARSAIVLTTLI